MLLPVLLLLGFFGVLLLGPVVPEPVDGSVLLPLRVLVPLPVVVPVIELSLPLPPVEEPVPEAPLPPVEDDPVPYVPVVPVVEVPAEPLTEVSVFWLPVVAFGALGSYAGAESLVRGAATPSCPVFCGCGEVALPDVLAEVPEREPLSEAQAPSSSPPAPSAAQSQSLFVVIRVFLP